MSEPGALVQVTVTNGQSFLPKDTPIHIVKALVEETSYLVEGHEFAHAFRKGWWDGREKMMTVSRKTGSYMIPTGIIPELLKTDIGQHLSLVDRRRLPGKRMDMAWIGPPPRGYQVGAIVAATADRGIFTGRGLLKMAIRSGKTLVAASIIQKLGYRTLFICTSEMLVHQTAKAFRKFLSPAPVATISGGIWNIDWITVTTIQSLMANPGRAAQLLTSVDIAFFDEAHHLEGEAWREPMLACDSPYKLGLSATVFARKDEPSEKSAIWLKAATGPILYSVSMSQLIDEGFLVPPQVLMYTIKDASQRGEGWSYKAAFDKLVVESAYRNKAIASLASDAMLRGFRVLIDTGREKQWRAISKMLDHVGHHKDFAVLHGKTSPEKRRAAMDDFQAGKLKCLIGTILGEGIDIPELEVVINAEAGKGKKATIQRMRNLTPDTDTPGKFNKKAIFIDFADMNNQRLRDHALERLRMYRAIRGIKITACGPDGGGGWKLPASVGTGKLTTAE